MLFYKTPTESRRKIVILSRKIAIFKVRNHIIKLKNIYVNTAIRTRT